MKKKTLVAVTLAAAAFAGPDPANPAFKSFLYGTQYYRAPQYVFDKLGGTWIVPKDALASGDWPAIEKLASDAATLVRRLRG